MMIYLAILNIVLSIIGVRRGFSTKSFITFIWLIVFYYSITSIVFLIGDSEFSVESKMTYTLNMTLCILAFLISDNVFNRKEKSQINLSNLESASVLIRVIELIFWISLLLTFVTLRTQDYATYNSAEGHAGWSQTFFQLTGGIVIYFLYKKQWLKVIIAGLLVVGMVATTGVRSLLYFIFLPILLYYLNVLMFSKRITAKTIFTALFVGLLVVFAVIVVNTLRFGEVELPETELTYISLNVMDHGGFPRQYFTSCMHYFLRSLMPIVNAINMLGADVVSPSSLLPPSIPKLNDMYANMYSTGEAHMPATIFHDFYMSFGYYGAIWAFFVFSWIKLLCNFLQKNAASFLALASVLGWHLYFLMRGSCDTCTGGVAYSLWLAIILYYVLNKLIKTTKKPT